MDAIVTAFSNVSALEWAAVISTAYCIYLAGQNKVLTWPVGIIAVLLYCVLFYEANLYADALLQVFFAGTSVYGWYVWITKRDSVETPIRRVTLSTLAILAGVAIAATYGYSMILVHYTDSPAPLLDASVLVFSIIGQLLLMLRYIDNWPVWILVNTVSVPLYFSRGLYVTAIMYAAFWLHAWYAWWKWNKEMK